MTNEKDATGMTQKVILTKSHFYAKHKWDSNS